MDLAKGSELLFYREIAALDEEHRVYIVQHRANKKIYVKKVRDYYDISVFKWLKENKQPGLPCIYALQEDGSSLTIIEEYVSGRTLEEILKEDGPFDRERAVSLMLSVCDILKLLHSQRPPIIHRDIKPSNIMQAEDGRLLLIDLNTCRRNKEGSTAENVGRADRDTVLMGTQGYAAPEQYGFAPSNIQTDIYALGMLFKTLLGGDRPGDIPEDKACSGIIEKCCHMDPEKRYQSTEELKAALEYLERPDPFRLSAMFKQPRSFLPPGFRQGNPAHMLPATLFYVFMIWFGLSMDFKDRGFWPNMIQRLGIMALPLSMVFVIYNYRNIQYMLPLCRSKNIFLRAVGILLLMLVIDIFILVLLMFLKDIPGRLP